jgi:hypothetical protein
MPEAEKKNPNSNHGRRFRPEEIVVLVDKEKRENFRKSSRGCDLIIQQRSEDITSVYLHLLGSFLATETEVQWGLTILTAPMPTASFFFFFFFFFSWHIPDFRAFHSFTHRNGDG